jgi:hypothetical protein
LKGTLNFQSLAKLIKKLETTVIEFFKLGIRSYHHGFDIRQPIEVHTAAHWQRGFTIYSARIRSSIIG